MSIKIDSLGLEFFEAAKVKDASGLGLLRAAPGTASVFGHVVAIHFCCGAAYDARVLMPEGAAHE